MLWTKLNGIVNSLVYKKGPTTYQMFKIYDHILLTHKHLFYLSILMCEVLSKVLWMIIEEVWEMMIFWHTKLTIILYALYNVIIFHDFITILLSLSVISQMTACDWNVCHQPRKLSLKRVRVCMAVLSWNVIFRKLQVQ